MEQFQELGIIQPILKALDASGYSEPTPIQEQAIPPLLRGADLLGCAQTGTGKTAAFAVPVLQNLYRKPQVSGKRPIRALILTPTRELAAQIDASFAEYGRFLPLKHTVIFGGVGQGNQVKALAGGVDILTATPGRLMDLVGQGFINLGHVEFFVLDEADRMLDMGFLHDVERVIGLLPSERQTMLFSATMPPEIEKLTRRILKNPEKIAVNPVASTVDRVEQRVYFVNKGNKTKLLLWLLQDQHIYSALVFTRTKHGANKLADHLGAAGESCGVIHSNKSQTARQQALADFKSGKLRVLAATDIVARGIDISELSLVVNYDIPESPEDYVHRIGRTGRAGLGGLAVSFCDAPEKASLHDIEKLTGKKIAVAEGHPYPLVIQPEPEGQRDERNAVGTQRKPSRPEHRPGTGYKPRYPEGNRAKKSKPAGSYGSNQTRRPGSGAPHSAGKPNGQHRRPGGETHPSSFSGGHPNRSDFKPVSRKPETHPVSRGAEKPAGSVRHTEEQKPRTAGNGFFGRKWFGSRKKRD